MTWGEPSFSPSQTPKAGQVYLPGFVSWFRTAALEFARLRADNLHILNGWRLTDAHMSLKGVHPEFGTVTMRQLLSTWVAHDLGHIVQISRVMATQYREAVGPWRAYLSVLR